MEKTAEEEATMRGAARSASRAYRLGDLGAALAGAGEAGEAIATRDWSSSPLGSPARWPGALRSAVGTCLAARTPLAVFWGPELAVVYNAAAIPLLGGAHPHAMGMPASTCVPALWPAAGPLLEAVLARGETGSTGDLLVPIERGDRVEETYVELAFSPIRVRGGGVGGVLGVATDRTARVLGDRRLATVSRLGEAVGGAKSPAHACRLAAGLIAASRPADVPFALLYLLSDEGRTARLAGAARVAPGSDAVPAVVDVAGDDDPWSMSRVVAGGEPVVVTALPEPLARLDVPLAGPAGPALTAHPRAALVLPLARAGEETPAGVMVAGLSPWQAPDGDHRAFLRLLAGQVATAVAGARAYEVERRRAEALAQLDDAKSALLGDVSHEFRTPLTLLLGPLEDAIADPRGLSPEQGERVRVAHRSALRLMKLVNALLDFSRIEAGRVRPALEPIDLAAVTANLAGYFRAAVERGGLRLTVDCPPLRRAAYVDREMWEKIVLNLISNAFKFTLEGEIRVALHATWHEFVLTVADTGTGIPADELPRIFRRFERVLREGARTREGTGIGLALVEELVRLLGGTVEVTSTVGAGSTFTVRLPIGAGPRAEDVAGDAGEPAPPALLGAESYVEEAAGWLSEAVPAAGADARPSAAPAAARGEPEGEGAGAERVVVADDNADMRAYLGHLLQRYWTVETCPDGATALAAARARPPGLVLTDIMMPGLDGLRLLRELRDDARTAHLPVVILSARSGPEAIVEGLEAGADDYLLKPFSARELIARVRANLERARLRNELAGARAEASLGQARRDFMNMAAHELRSPLTVIGGYLSMLQDGTIGPASADFPRAVEAMQGKAQEAGALVDHVLIAARLESGRLQLDLGREDLRDLLAESVARARPLADMVGEALELRVPDAAVPVRVDRRYVGRVLDNLVTNALTHGAGGGVRVSLSSDGAGAVATVRDRGPGVPAAARHRVFEPFVRGDDHIGGTGGTGLGLSISRRLAEAHGGTVALEEDEGPGAAFSVRLPLDATG